MTTILYLGDAAIDLDTYHLRDIIDQTDVTITLDDGTSDPARPLYRIESPDFDVVIITDAGSPDDMILNRKAITR